MAVLPRYVVRAGNLVWVVDEQKTLRNRKVTTLRTGSNEIYVTEGLQNGDLVALTLVEDALPGMTVDIGQRLSTDRGDQQPIEAAGKLPGPADTSPPEAAKPGPTAPGSATPGPASPNQTSSQQEQAGIAAA